MKQYVKHKEHPKSQISTNPTATVMEKLKKTKKARIVENIVPRRPTYPTPASANFSAHAFPRTRPFCKRSNLSTSSPHQQEVLNSRSKRISNI